MNFRVSPLFFFSSLSGKAKGEKGKKRKKKSITTTRSLSAEPRRTHANLAHGFGSAGGLGLLGGERSIRGGKP